MKKNSKINMMLLASIMMSGDFSNDSFNAHTVDVSAIDVSPVKKVVPKGCKEYFFGHHPDEQFSCIALNEESATKKYNKWKLKQNKATN